MSSDRWERMKSNLTEILEQDPSDWPTCLVTTCGDDVDLFLEVSTLLAKSRSIGDFIEVPAWSKLASPPPRHGSGG